MKKYNEIPANAEQVSDQRDDEEVAQAEIDNYLASTSADELRTWLRTESSRNETLKDKLFFASKSRPDTSLADILALVVWATSPLMRPPIGNDASYGDCLLELAGLLERRIAYGNQELIPLVEQAICRGQGALALIHDSHGEAEDALVRLRAVHAAACNALRPDPMLLAGRLFELECASEQWPAGQVPTAYAEALGEAGMAAYRDLVKQAWKAAPALLPNDSIYPWLSDHGNVQAAMEALTVASESIDELARVKSKNLFSPSCFLEIATLYRERGRHAEALSWAEKGLQAFVPGKTQGLVSFAVAACLALGNEDRAEELAWLAFQEAPYFGYPELMRVGAKLGRRAELGVKATSLLRELMAAEEGGGRGRQQSAKRARSALVSAYLQEGDVSKMWAVFSATKVDSALHVAVAAARAATHPEEAIKLYLSRVDPLVESGKQKADYREAAEIVARIHELRAREGNLDLFAEELSAIHSTWKARRNFIKLLPTLT